MSLHPWRDVMRSALILLLVQLTKANGGPCPHECTCNETIIKCRHSNLTSLPANLPLAERIQTLQMTGNRIKHIGTELHNYPALETIDVSSNNISDIKNGAFDSLSRLDNLILRRNYLAKLANDTFQGLTKLKTLDLGYNMLKVLPDKAFYDLRNLQHLDLMKNNISTIQDDAFLGLRSLRVLNLTRNLLQIFPTKAFSKITSLHRLVLDDNKLKTIPRYAFSGLVNLTFLSLNGNHLETIDPYAFSGVTPPLKQLSLKGADLDDVPIVAFSRLTKLEILDISKNNFSTLKRGSFSELVCLRKLTVTSSKYLNTIENGTFQFMFNLEEVVIKNNPELVSIGLAAFPSAQTLKLVDLSSNSVKTFHPNIVDWDNNVTVDFRNNPILCDCNIVWMVSTLKNAADARTRLYAANLTCAAPTSYSGKPVLSLPVSQFRCSVTRPPFSHQTLSRVKVAAIAAVTTSFILVSCALFIKFRKKICMVVRRQYRYRHYKNNGVFTVNGHNGDLYEEGTPMEVRTSYKDDPDIHDSDQ